MEESQKLFRLPGTIGEEEEREMKEHNPLQTPEGTVRLESPLLYRKGTTTISSLPKNITLVRVSTQSSSIGGVYRQDSTRSRYRAGPTRKLRRRAVLKNGDCNVLQSRISKRSLRFLQDIFTTLVDTQWRWTLMCFILSFFLSWLGFAVIWWLIAFTHGDFDEEHLPNVQQVNHWTPCVLNIFNFTSCFLFSIETQHTIGYGGRSTTEECPEAIFVMCIQSISGVMIQAFMVGIVFAKMTRPKQRTQTLLFSRNAVICQRDGELCLMFRVGDMRKSHIIGATVRAQIIRTRTTKEGEILSQNQQELMVGTDGQNGDLFFIWPTTIIHKINEDSPFYNMSAEDMLTERFEVVLILEGTVESTGQTTQARSSYLPQEILWGHRFDPMVNYSKERQGYEVDYSIFNSTTQIDTPLCSGKELTEFYKVQDDLRHTTGVLIDEDQLTEKQCRCACRPINQQRLRLPFTRLDTTRSNSMADNRYWQDIYKDPNYTSHDTEVKNINPLKVFDFDTDTIQMIEDMEHGQLPAVVNKEILKNGREFLFDEKDKVTIPIEKPPKKRLIRLDVGKSGTLRNNCEKTEFPHVQSQSNHTDIQHRVNHILQDSGESRMRKKNLARKRYELCIDERLRMQERKCQLITAARNQRNAMRNVYMSRKRKSLRCGGNSIDDHFMLDDTVSKRNIFNRNVRESKEGSEPLKESGKYLLVALDHLHDSRATNQRNSISYQRLNRVPRWEHDRMKMQSENDLEMIFPCKLYSTDIQLPVSPISDLSAESRLHEDRPTSFNSECNHRDIVLARNNCNSLENRGSQKDFVRYFDSTERRADVQTSIFISNSVQDVDNTSSFNDLTYKQYINDNDRPINWTDNSTVKEQVICMDSELQNVNKVREKCNYSNNNVISKKLINNIDREEPVVITEEQFIHRDNRKQNIDEVLVRRNGVTLNSDIARKYLVNNVNYSGQCDEAVNGARQVICSNNTLKNIVCMRKTSISLDDNTPCENLVKTVIDRENFAEKRVIYTSV